MKVECTYRASDPLPGSLLALGNTSRTVFNICYGHQYSIYGMSLWKNVLHYLILSDETQRPDWFPANLFKVIDGRLPSDWHYAFWGDGSEDTIQAVWGYAELAQDAGAHYSALIEREPYALQVFYDRRAEIDNWLGGL